MNSLTFNCVSITYYQHYSCIFHASTWSCNFWSSIFWSSIFRSRIFHLLTLPQILSSIFQSCIFSPPVQSRLYKHFLATTFYCLFFVLLCIMSTRSMQFDTLQITWSILHSSLFKLLMYKHRRWLCGARGARATFLQYFGTGAHPATSPFNNSQIRISMLLRLIHNTVYFTHFCVLEYISLRQKTASCWGFVPASTGTGEFTTLPRMIS